MKLVRSMHDLKCKIISIIHRWGLSILIMMVIFTFSSIPSAELPSLGWFDMLVKKGGHILGYGILSMAYLRGLDMDKKNLWIAWLLSIIYSITDEIHQIFVPGRHASVWDIGFDAVGAAITLFLYRINNKKNPIWWKNTR